MKIIEDIDSFLISEDESLENILSKMEAGTEGILLVVDSKNYLVGTITDGDIRRELISNGLNSASNARKIMNRDPVFTDSDREEDWSQILLEHDIEHLPVCNSRRKIVSLVRYKPSSSTDLKDNSVIIFAGGKGIRMGEKFSNIPKPLIEIEGVSLIERVINNLINEGFRNISIALNHQADQVMKYLDSKDYNIDFNYIIEEVPQGTAGSIVNCVDRDSKDLPILALNADIIFSTNLTKFLEHHLELKNDVTIGTAKYSLQVPYGVVEDQDISDRIVIHEKPIHKFNVLAGIYIINKSSLSNIKPGALDMDHLINHLQSNEASVGYYDIGSKWIDVGNEESLKMAEKFVESKLFN